MRREHVRTCVQVFAWVLLGVAGILYSAHTRNDLHAQLAFYGGLAIGNCGILYTLAAAARRGEEEPEDDQ